MFEGTPVSRGVGIGNLIYVKYVNYDVNPGLIDESEVESQITDLEVAICKTFIEIHDLKDGFKGILSSEENRIFEFYKEILDDNYFFEEIKNVIREKRYYADRAVFCCIQNYIDCIEDSGNEYVKHRISDLNDVRKRLIRNMHGDNEISFDEIDSTHIVIVKELSPIIAGVLSKKEVKGVIAQEGAGYFSHASIILKSVGIPLLNDIDFKEIIQYKDKQAIIDCNKGVLIVNPDSSDITSYEDIIISKDNARHYETIEPTITTDGQRISLYASISSIKEFNMAKGFNFDGIGLVRTESLFINYTKVPDEKKQFSIYSRIAKGMDNKVVVLRTVDIGGDKLPDMLSLNSEASQSVSRGVRRSLEHKDELAVQIRSIIRAIAYGNVRITFPMVNSVEEIREIKEIIRDIQAQPDMNNIADSGKIKIGAFIETISAVDDIKNIICEVDFINIGTNDLLHQYCGSNRKCSAIKKDNYLDPEFIKIVKLCVDTAKDQDKPVIICGEMAADPMTVLILLGLGVREFSITPGAFSDIYDLIRKVNYKDAIEITESAIHSNSIDEVKKILSDWISRM